MFCIQLEFYTHLELRGAQLSNAHGILSKTATRARKKAV